MPSPTTRPLWRRIAKWAILALAILMLGLVLFVLAFDLSGSVARMAGKNTGREVTLDGKPKIDWGLKPRVTLSGIAVGNMVGLPEPLMASARKISVTVDAKHLLRGRVVIPELVLENPDIILEKDKDGNANWKFGSNPEGQAVGAVTPDSRSEIPAIGRLLIHDGRLRYRDAQQGVDIDAKLGTIEGNMDRRESVQIEGSGIFQGKPLKFSFTGASVLSLQDTSEPYPLKVELSVGDTHATLEGTVMDPLQLKGLDLNLTVRGKDAADLYALTGIALPHTPPYRLQGQLGLEEQVWKFTDFKGKMGSSDLNGRLSWDTRPTRPLFIADFTSKRLDFADLGGLIGATPDIQADSSATQKQQAATAEADPRVIPDMPLDISRLSAMDAQVRFTGTQIIATDLPLDNFLMNLQLDDRLLLLKPLKFGTASGDVAADVTINARTEPVKIAADVDVRRLALSRLFAGLEKTLNAAPSRGYIGGRAKLTGSGKSLRAMLASSNGTIGLGMEGGRLSNLIIELLGLDVAQSLGLVLTGDQPVAVRCVIADFGVKNGLMQSNALVIDTSDTQLRGKGSLNLNDEALDLVLRAEPKDATLISARTPITVGGTLKKPDVGVKGRNLLVRGGAAAGLAILFPPAALVAFIEPALGKDSECATLIRTMNARAGSKALVPKNK
jgi:uncharacterized protein involved in outer membrane biogenesis